MSEYISPVQTELPAKPSYDAVLVHGYWLSRDNGHLNVNGFRGSLRTRLATRAAADIYHTEGPTKLVFTGGNLKGPDYPSTSSMARIEAVNKYGIPDSDVITTETGLDTESESLTFEELSRKNEWKNVGVLSFEQHKPSVSRFSPRIEGANVEHRSVEEILETYDHPLISDLAQRLKQSRYGLGFKSYEIGKRIIMSIPGGKDWLYGKNRVARAEKNDSKFNDIVTRLIDVYNS